MYQADVVSWHLLHKHPLLWEGGIGPGSKQGRNKWAMKLQTALMCAVYILLEKMHTESSTNFEGSGNSRVVQNNCSGVL